jgi:cysteine-rich repeat protein
MQRTFSSSRSAYRFDRKGISWALTAILAAGAPACGDSGLDVGDDTARVGSDEEVGAAGNGDDSAESDAEEMVAETDEPAEDAMAGDEPSDDATGGDEPSSVQMDGENPAEPSDPPSPVMIMPPAPGVNPTDPAAPVQGGTPTLMPNPNPPITPSPMPVTPMPVSPTGPIAMCDVGLVNCAAECVDLTRDSSHCGACGVVCGFGLNCVMGACQGGCGNAVLDGMEGCDDGNAVDGDGCSQCKKDGANCVLLP